MGCDVTVCGPPTLIPRGIESLGCGVRTTLDHLSEAGVLGALRGHRQIGFSIAADIVPARERGRFMGLIGAAFGAAVTGQRPIFEIAIKLDYQVRHTELPDGRSHSLREDRVTW